MEDTPQASPPAPRPWYRRWWVGGLVVLVALAAAVTVAGWLEHRAWARTTAAYDAEVTEVHDEAATSRARAQEAYTAHLVTLEGVIDDGSQVFATSAGQVADPAVREPLATAIEDAQALGATEVDYPVATRTVEEVSRANPLYPETLPQVEVEVVDGSVPAPADLDAAAARVTAASQDVVAARQQWASDRLGDALVEGRDALVDLGGQVEAGELEDLKAAVDAAEASQDAGVDAVDPDQALTLGDTVLKATDVAWSDRLAQVYAERRAQGRADGIDCRVDRCVALTFDDGPVADTRRLLRILARKDAPATFFMLGENVAQRPEIARAVANRGHLIANHSWNHPQLTTLDDAQVRDQLRRTQQAITQATGTTPFMLRPPYGDVDSRVRSLAHRTGLDVVLWNLDTEDWRTRDAEATRDRVLADVADGSNVLMHDIHRSTVDAVGDIIDDLREEGYVLVTVDLLVGDD